MGVASALGKFAGKAAAKIGAGAAAGTAVEPGGGTALGGLLGGVAVAADVVPLLTDLFSRPEVDQDQVEQVGQVRDGLAARMAAAEGIPIAKATEIVNAQMKPLIDKAAQPTGGVSGGKTLTDLAALGITGGMFMANRRMAKALRGPKAAASSTAAAAERDAGQTTKEVDATLDDTYKPGFRSPAVDKARAGELDEVSGQGGFGGYLPGPSEVRDATLVPPDGGVMPMSDDELMQMAIASKLRGMPQRPPGAFNPVLGLPMGPETARRHDVGRMKSRMYGREGD